MGGIIDSLTGEGQAHAAQQSAGVLANGAAAAGGATNRGYNAAIQQTAPYYTGGLAAYNKLLALNGVAPQGGEGNINSTAKEIAKAFPTFNGKGGLTYKAGDTANNLQFVQHFSDQAPNLLATEMNNQHGAMNPQTIKNLQGLLPLAQQSISGYNASQNGGNTQGGALNDYYGSAQYRAIFGDDAMDHPGESAIDRFHGTPGYQFALDQGSRQVTNNAAASGLLNSGQFAKNLTNFAQGQADQNYNSYLDQLIGNFNSYQGNLTNLANAGFGIAQNNSRMAFDQGGNNANAILGGAAARAGGITNAANSRAAGMQSLASLGTSLLTGGASIGPSLFGAQQQQPVNQTGGFLGGYN